MSSRTIVIAAGIIMLGCSAGFLSFSTWRYQQAYELAAIEARNLEAALSNTSMLYGIIRSLDIANNTLTIETPNPYIVGQAPIVYTLPILSTTFIGHQTLVAQENGVYTALSSTTPSTMSALQPGMKVKFFVASHNMKSSIYYLLYGDPL